MEPNIFRFAVVYNFIHVLLLEFQVRFWIRLPGLSMLHACACAKAGTWFLMIWRIQWSLKELKRPVFLKTGSFWKDIRCEVNVCFIHIGGIVRIVDNHWLYLLVYDYFVNLNCLTFYIMIYKYEWLCILMLNIDIVDDIWVVNLRERSASCFLWSILGYSLFLFLAFFFVFLFFFLCTFLIKCLSHRKPCKLVT